MKNSSEAGMKTTPAFLDRRAFLQFLGSCGAVSAVGGGWAAAAGTVGEERFKDLAGFVATQVQGGEVPGAGVIVARKERTLYEQFRGTYCSHERPDEPFDGSVVNICYSFSKLISATVIVMLQQDGLLEYDAPISKYVPQFTGGGKEKITLRHLLTHSAGIPGVPLKAVGNDQEWEAAVRAVCDAKVEWEPGSRCVYHGLTGLLVAAEAARRVTGKGWAALCKERLFDPLGASSMSFELPPRGTKLSLVPQPKPEVLKQLSYGQYYAISFLGHPAGACFGTAGDMLKVLQLHLNKGVWRGKALIRPLAFAEMHTVQYEKEIARAVKEGKAPAHQSWGLGPLLRGTGPADQGHAWFGFGDRPSPGIFGHAGISTIIGVGDPSLDLAIIFLTTDPPKPESKATAIRNGITNRVFQALGGIKTSKERAKL